MNSRTTYLSRLGAVAVILTVADVASPQAPQAAVQLTIEVENNVAWRGDTFELSKIAANPGSTTSVPRNFLYTVGTSDIVRVNGSPAKGLRAYQVQRMAFRVNAAPGEVMANINGETPFSCVWHIVMPDGTYIGSIMDAGAQPSPYHVITGGTGAFFGVTGIHRSQQVTAQREASTSEDPSNRWIHGGGQARYTFQLFPKDRPEVEMSSAGPGVFHADFSPVTSSRPAERGEALIVRTTGLGPVKPNLDPPGIKPFAAQPVEEVNSPVVVMFEGTEVPVLNKIGWPGETYVYRIDFRVPDDAPAGMAKFHIVSAWIPGSSVTIPVR